MEDNDINLNNKITFIDDIILVEIVNKLENILTTYNVDMVRMARLAIEQVINETMDPTLAGTIYEIDSYVVKRSSVKDMRKK